MTVLLDREIHRFPSELSCDQIADAAVDSLIAEARLTPKPGLVDARGNHTHPDMTVALLETSAHALRDSFEACAAVSREMEPGLALRERLGAIGRDGERRMLSATGDVNTHRGALWALGLLAAGAAASESISGAAEFAGRLAALPDVGLASRPESNGRRVWRRYGAGGAVAEAQSGFPTVFGVGLPQLRESRRRGESEETATLNALIAIMASLDDTCVLHRGGPLGLEFVRVSAALVLAAGGAGTVKGRSRLHGFCADADLRMLSMGGSADLLAATLFVDRLGNGA